MPVRRVQNWYVIGVIDVTAPGRYEVLSSNSSGVAIRPISDENASGADLDARVVTLDVGDTQIFHTCSPCTCCSACACREGRELCAGCVDYRRWAQQAEPDLERYQAACGRPEGWFAVTGSNTVHVVGCSSLASTVNAVIKVLDDGCQHRYGHEPRAPKPVRAEEIRGGRRCRVCVPGISPPTQGTGRFTTGGGRDV
jgi:hypothetical protein